MEENKKIQDQEMDKVSGGVKLSRKAKIGLGAGLGVAGLTAGGIVGGVALKKRKDKNKKSTGAGAADNKEEYEPFESTGDQYMDYLNAMALAGGVPRSRTD